MTLQRCILLVLPVALTACRDVQSVMAPLSQDAERIATLSWVLFVGGAVIFLGVLLATGLALLGSPRMRRPISGERIVLWGGLIFPTVTLAVLLGYGFAVLGAGASNVPRSDAVRIRVLGEMWWWRVIYQQPDGTSFETANELRIPVGRPVQIELTSNNVIHSFWVPNLAGKLDMIPGRTNILTLTAAAPGISRGQCAEYCGGAHALMAFYVIALTQGDYQSWLRTAGRPATKPELPLLKRGQQLFMTSGCAACHTIRGTTADGIIGPDLTRVGQRLSIAAATLPASKAAFAQWLVNNQQIKPENKMPPYGIFSAVELEELSAYLGSLR